MDPPTPTALVPPFVGEMENEDLLFKLPSQSRPTPSGASRPSRPVFTPQHTNGANEKEKENDLSSFEESASENRATSKRKSSTVFTSPETSAHVREVS